MLQLPKTPGFARTTRVMTHPHHNHRGPHCDTHGGLPALRGPTDWGRAQAHARLPRPGPPCEHPPFAVAAPHVARRQRGPLGHSAGYLLGAHGTFPVASPHRDLPPRPQPQAGAGRPKRWAPFPPRRSADPGHGYYGGGPWGTRWLSACVSTGCQGRAIAPTKPQWRVRAAWARAWPRRMGAWAPSVASPPPMTSIAPRGGPHVSTLSRRPPAGERRPTPPSPIRSAGPQRRGLRAAPPLLAHGSLRPHWWRAGRRPTAPARPAGARGPRAPGPTRGP
jgi:hypothetical protein